MRKIIYTVDMTMKRLRERENQLKKLICPLAPGIGNIYYFDCVSSTMDVAFSLEENSVVNYTLIVSELQTHGRGRLGRRWYSGDQDLHFSVLLTVYDFRIPYSMISSYAVYRAFLRYTEHVKLKWINDVLWDNGLKIAGVLTEEQRCRTVIGIGVNLNSDTLHEDVRNAATTYYIETGKTLPKELFLRDILSELLFLFHRIETRGVREVLGDWEKEADICGKKVMVEDEKGRYSGTA
jgi:BirA family biotin operon repressor/biotin-[acetyl-CoA-carboxylase] ligase